MSLVNDSPSTVVLAVVGYIVVLQLPDLENA